MNKRAGYLHKKASIHPVFGLIFDLNTQYSIYCSTDALKMQELLCIQGLLSVSAKLFA